MCEMKHFLSFAIFVLTLTGYGEVQNGFPNQTGVMHERKRSREERLQELKEARIPLTYEVPAGSKFELFGYVMGRTYQPAASGSKFIYGVPIPNSLSHPPGNQDDRSLPDNLRSTGKVISRRSDRQCSSYS